MIRPLSHELAPMPEMVRELYGTPNAQIERALDDLLIEHRDALFRGHFTLPLDF
jgi:hypothetical protein